MKRWILPSAVLLTCLLAVSPSSVCGDEKADREAAKRAAREAERARVQAERQRAEEQRQARREADRQRKEARKQSGNSGGGGRDSGNASIRTQRETAASYDELRRKSLDKEKDATSSRESKEAADEADEKKNDPLAAIDEQIRAEDKRHAEAVAKYRKAIESARRSRDAKAVRDAEVALAREDETYRKAKESLQRRREEMSKGASERESSKDEPVRSAGNKEAPRRR